ncbi:G-D-S-L family lipolytic protein [Tenacibaculum sp. SG-28]|nr:G-D-S-L family lipolytic protein [Tenacibaculum sp. SG-28]PQJ21997.1 G-D-S-L family lipolytic protein [Tenacibaculum sp. SG-28]
MKNKFIWMLGLTVALTSCDVNNELDEILPEELPVVELNVGTVDFSNYIAVGASFSSGYTDNALFIEAQNNSFPNIMASKFAMGNGGEFNQPMMKDNIGGFTNSRQDTVLSPPRLYFNGAGPAVLPAIPTTILGAPADNATSFNNYGIPGARSFHLVAPGYEQANAYYGRMTPTQATLLEEIVSKQPTFFSLSEIGGNDVLGYATSGGDQSRDAITPIGTFNAVFRQIADALTAQGAKGVLANVPYITYLPYFTTVPYNAVPMDAATAAVSNQGFAAYNGGIQQAFAALVAAGAISQDAADAEIAKRTISFAPGQNAVVILDEALTDLTGINAQLVSMRQATSDDLLVLTSSSFIGTTVGGNPALVNGVSVPLADNWVLTADEVQEVREATDAYNTTIKAVADEKGLAFVDLNVVLEQAANSALVFDDYIMSTDLVFGGLVSLDGIHLTSRGYALMANKLLEAIDLKYGSNFATATDGLAKADDYPTNYSPSLR